jgi:hypothetical protein
MLEPHLPLRLVLEEMAAQTVTTPETKVAIVFFLPSHLLVVVGVVQEPTRGLVRQVVRVVVKQTQLLALELRVQETKVDLHHPKEITAALGVVAVVMMHLAVVAVLVQ